jgi:hypothetical protein
MALVFVLVVLSSILGQMEHLALMEALLYLSLTVTMEEVLEEVNLFEVMVIQFR